MIGLRQEVQVFRYLGKCPHGHDYDRMNYFPEILLMIYLTYLDQGEPGIYVMQEAT